MTIAQYVEHPEYKFDGDVGLLERKHIHAERISTIGKEANNIDEQDLEITKPQEFRDKKEIMEKILAMKRSEAEAAGVDWKNFRRIKTRIREEGDIKLKTKAVKRLIEPLG